jgi:sRNA-binding carbon storage regulator CsrA
MLTLGRKVEETIDIDGGFENGGITIVLCQLRPKVARIGIKAGPKYKILRGELRDTTSPQSVSEEATVRIQTNQAG